MPNAIKLSVAVGALALAGCSGEPNPDQNVVITNDIPPDAEIEAVPSDEGAPANADERSPEERGDGDDMVNIIDDTGNGASNQ